MNHDGGLMAPASCATIATWPKGSFVESVAVAASGRIFVTLHTGRLVAVIDPVSHQVTEFAHFDTPVAGLVFARDGILFVSAGKPGQAPGVLWRVARDGAVSKAADLPDAVFLNGMCLHPDGQRVLVAESILGRIYAVDPATGTVEVWLDDARLSGAPGDATPGVNGIKIAGGHVVLSVTRSDGLFSTTLDAYGAPGAIATLADNLRADDFAIAADGSLFIATHPACSLVRLAPDGTRTTLAGAEQGMTGATAVAFGRSAHDRESVYVTTTGGTMILPDDQLEPAKLVRVDVGIASAGA